MDKLKHIDAEAYEWLASRDAKSRAYFSTFPTCDILLNNLYVTSITRGLNGGKKITKKSICSLEASF